MDTLTTVQRNYFTIHDTKIYMRQKFVFIFPLLNSSQNIYSLNVFLQFGPDNPNLTAQQKAIKNTLTGYVESTNINDFQFENQRRTFATLGYALDPSDSSGQVIGNKAEAEEKNSKR